MEDALRSGAREFDFLRGGEAYKYRWGAATGGIAVAGSGACRRTGVAEREGGEGGRRALERSPEPAQSAAFTCTIRARASASPTFAQACVFGSSQVTSPGSRPSSVEVSPSGDVKRIEPPVRS